MAPKPPGKRRRLSTSEEEGFIAAHRLCELAGISKVYFYALVKQGRAPKPVQGVPLKEARLWLQARAAAAAAKAEVTQAAAQSVRAGAGEGEK